MTTSAKNRVPVYSTDFYSDEFILDPYPHYQAMRALGPVVWLPENKAYAITQYKEVSEILRQPLTFISSKGVSLNPQVNKVLRGSTLNSDPPEHDRTRAITSAPLLPGALKEVEGRIKTAADGLVDRLCKRGSFDAIEDFAEYLPVTIVAELVGLPKAGRDNMLKWASATFNLFGDENQRAKSAMSDLAELAAFLQEYGRPEKLKAGGWAERIFAVGAEQGLSFETCAQLMRDYINPSLDTTISATGQLIKLLADNPDQWQRLRQDPSLIPNAVNESVRLASPIRALSRYVAETTSVAGVELLEGDRVLVVYASANRDELKYEHADNFDVTRNVVDHVGFGQGVHMCMGMHLARLEMESLLQSLVVRVSSFRLDKPPIVAINNTIRAYQSLPVSVTLDAAQPDSGSVLSTGSQAETWQEVVITERVPQAEGVASFTLASSKQQPLLDVGAGSHIDVQIKEGLVRQYSLCTAPGQQGLYRIAVQQESKSRGGSETIHEHWAVGNKIRISAAKNHFRLEDDEKFSILLAGGIGITPILSMAYALEQQQRPFKLYYSTKNSDRVAFSQELEAFGNKVEFVFSEKQRLDFRELLSSAKQDSNVYACGPGGFVDALVAAAADNGWHKNQVHYERFAAEVDTDGDAFKVVATKSGKTVTVEPGETIAQKLQEVGINVPMSCQSGVCGTCLTKVLSGRPDHRDLVLTDLEKAQNEKIAVCCSRSESKILSLDI